MFISSDTNVWLDLCAVDQIDQPFRLDNSYYLSSITYHDEVDISKRHNNDNGLYSEVRKCVKENKILITDATTDELKLAMRYESKYRPPIISCAISIQDSIALAIAKERKWCLFTGDKGLREAAKIEDVECHGTLWIFDELLKNKLLSRKEYLHIMEKLLEAVDCNKRRLPKSEILKRIENKNK